MFEVPLLSVETKEAYGNDMVTHKFSIFLSSPQGTILVSIKKPELEVYYGVIYENITELIGGTPDWQLEPSCS